MKILKGVATRAKLLLKNSFVILFSTLFCYLADFLCRTVLVHTLSMEYVGVTGLFPISYPYFPYLNLDLELF